MNPFTNLLSKAATHPDEVFFSLKNCTDGELTFSKMRDGIASAACFLRGAGVKSDDIVLIFAQHSKGKLFAFFGAQLLGAIPAFLPPPTSKQPIATWTSNHRAVIERLEPKLIVCEEPCLTQVSALSTKPVVATQEIEQAHAAAWPENFIFDPTSIAFLQHSSGTTGLKKGVMVTHAQLGTQVAAYAEAIDFDPARNCVVSWLPVYHDMGLIAATLLPFLMGAPVHLLNTFEWLNNPASYMDLLARHPSSCSWLPNFAFSFLAMRCKPPEAGSLGKVSAIINCSEPCKAEAMNGFIGRFEPAGLRAEAVQICYAMAEYVFAVTQTDRKGSVETLSIDADQAEQHIVSVASRSTKRNVEYVSVGKPIKETEVRIATGSGSIGEVLIRGPSLCSGYFGNAEKTREDFQDGWYNTRDLGFVHDSELYITGRRDDLIIIRGRNIYAHDIEALVNKTGQIKPGRVVAFGVFEEAIGTQDMVILAEADSTKRNPGTEKVIRALVLELYGISPADIVLVAPDMLIKTTSGKISRTENLAQYLDHGFESGFEESFEDGDV